MRMVLQTALLAVALFLSGCGDTPPDVPTPPETATPAAQPAAPAPPTQSPPWRLIHSQGIMHFVHIDEAHWKDQDQYRLAIADICSGKNICQVMFWKSPDMVPRSMPMTDVQVAAKVAHWQYNGNTGHRQLLWSCELVNDPRECFQ